MADAQNRLDNFAVDYLNALGDLKERSIQRWHMATDFWASGVFASGYFGKVYMSGDIVPESSGSYNVGTQQYAFGGMNAQTGRFDTLYATNIYGSVLHDWTVDHAQTANRNWASAGHTFDTNLDLNGNSLINADYIKATNSLIYNDLYVGASGIFQNISTKSITASGNIVLDKWIQISEGESGGWSRPPADTLRLFVSPDGWGGSYLSTFDSQGGVIKLSGLHSDLANLNWSGAGHLIDTDLEINDGNVIPGISGSFQVGTQSRPFHEGDFETIRADTAYLTNAYVGGDSLYIGGNKISADASGAMVFRDAVSGEKHLYDLIGGGAGKVSGAALTSLASIPAGAGVIPVANIPNLDASKITTGTLAVARCDTGTTANKLLQLNGDAKIPAVDGSLLTNVKPSDLAIASQARGDILYFDGSNWKRLPKGTDGQYLKIGANDPAWAACTMVKGVYDTGAVVWASSTNYTVTHNLGTTKVLIQLFIRKTGSTKWCDGQTGHRDNGYIVSPIYDITDNTISFRTENINNPTDGVFSSGHYRVIVVAFD